MPPRLLALRPASVVTRLAPRNGACPIALRDLLGPALRLGLTLPLVRAPYFGVARAALVAAKETQSALGLALPPGVPPEPWFRQVTAAADEVAFGLPIFLSGEVAFRGGAEPDVEAAVAAAWELVEAGLTHVALDAAAVPAGSRAAALAAAARGPAERGVSLDLVLPIEGAGEAPALVSALAGAGLEVDLVSVRCPAPADAAGARAQLRRAVETCAALRGLPVLRRGPLHAALLDLLRGSPVAACEDGGAASDAASSLVPWELIDHGEAPESRAPALERAAAELSDEGVDRLEARAYVEVAHLVERLGAAGSAPRLSEALERALGEG